jgi:hypothetical protein
MKDGNEYDSDKSDFSLNDRVNIGSNISKMKVESKNCFNHFNNTMAILYQTVNDLIFENDTLKNQENFQIVI